MTRGTSKRIAGLSARLVEAIQRDGPMPFDRFMETALYDPEEGYYERRLDQIGRQGDFFTSVSVGPLFGELLGVVFAAWLERMDVRGPLWLIEAGAHDGRLAADLLGWFGRERPDMLRRLRYGIVEPSWRRREAQRQTLASWEEQVRWFERLPVLAGEEPRGVCFGNELLDALPVRRFAWDANRREWREMGVAVEREDPPRFAWRALPGPPRFQADERAWCAEILGRSPELAEVLPPGCVWEQPSAALRWWREAASALASGWLVAIDYGHWTGGGPDAARPVGTLRGFARHHQTADPLADPGGQDLTVDVDFGLLRRVGESAGLRTEVATTQGRWLTGVVASLKNAAGGQSAWDTARRRQFATLTHPEQLGDRFQVLIQRKEG